MNEFTKSGMSGLFERLKKKEAKLAVIGLGYVGLPIALAFARKLFPATVLSTDDLGIAMLNAVRHGAPKQVLESRDIRALVGGAS